MKNCYTDGKIMLLKQEGGYLSHFDTLKIILHGFNLVKAEVKVNGASVNVKYEDMKYIEPISDYDPYHKPPKPPMFIEKVPFIEVKNSPDEIIVVWKF